MISLCENCAYKMTDCEGNKDIEKVACQYFKKMAEELSTAERQLADALEENSKLREQIAELKQQNIVRCSECIYYTTGKQTFEELANSEKRNGELAHDNFKLKKEIADWRAKATHMKFEKISRQQWYKDYTWCDNVGIIDKLYDDIKLPKQGSIGSAGMDFFAYEDITIRPNEILEVPTGIRWVTPMSNHVLYLFPRSGSGIKGLSLVNTVAVIDESYQFADNEGHIILFLINRGSEPITIKKGKGIVQGIVSPYVICDGANDSSDRTGGFGSTDKKQKIGE